MRTSLPELDLINLATRGDGDALSALLELHGPTARRGLEIPRRFQSLVSVDDVMQQTYTDAFLRIREFVPREDGSFAGWLGRMARRNLVDVIRMLTAEKRGGDRQRLHVETFGSSLHRLSVVLGVTEATASHGARMEEACAALGEAITALPPLYRRVIERFDLQDRPVEELADELKRTTGAVYMIRSRAHRLIRERMGRLEDYVSDGA
ncbi:MAG: sigma-70 family RNA polymerase sigma factor [Phycisphaerales bacterium]|nr:sigma-70 family RNA polymerase sigma factor [Phycisphaerales bacterium]